MSRLLLAASCLAFAAVTTAQTTVVVPCTADATLYEDPLGGTANGSGAGMFVGLNGAGRIRRAVLRFDLTTWVPAGAVVVTAQLNLNSTQTTVVGPTPLTGHRLLAAWGEGASVAPGNGGGGTLAATGDATWIHTFYSTSTWTSPGGDFAATPTLTASMPAFGTFSSNLSAATTADVQFWLDNPASNHGWILRTDELLPSTAHRIASRESTSKPTLTVSYLLAGQNGNYGTGCVVGAGNFSVDWLGAPIGGSTIQVDKSGAPANSLGADFFALTIDPFGTQLIPGCLVHLPIGTCVPGLTFPTNGAGSGQTSFFVPPGFPGFLIATQSAVLDSSPAGYVLSDVALIVLQ